MRDVIRELDLYQKRRRHMETTLIYGLYEQSHREGLSGYRPALTMFLQTLFKVGVVLAIACFRRGKKSLYTSHSFPQTPLSVIKAVAVTSTPRLLPSIHDNTGSSPA